MKRYVKVTSQGRIDTTVIFPKPEGQEYFEFDFPEGFDFERQSDYRIAKGNLIHDPLPEPEQAPDIMGDIVATTIDHEYRLILMERGMSL